VGVVAFGVAGALAFAGVFFLGDPALA